ncbi:hypothetical protein NQ317_011664 [Molorchus minor]|uniref:C2H2-type domain-containing protein n=1 Tax=Molorchus minor TaxID=1323400 RepID=A0ABQ9JGI9_9CUCU|nr:hypothetical protein NQ317_011664 [Molorchus minor]
MKVTNVHIRPITKNIKKCSVDHGDALDVAIYKCSDCEFKTKYRANLKSHSLIHKDASEVTMYKCDQCKYNARWKNNLKRHSLVHKGAKRVHGKHKKRFIGDDNQMFKNANLSLSAQTISLDTGDRKHTVLFCLGDIWLLIYKGT